MPMHDMFKKKNMQRKTKAQRIEMLLNMVASMFLGDVGVIGCTTKVIVKNGNRPGLGWVFAYSDPTCGSGLATLTRLDY